MIDGVDVLTMFAAFQESGADDPAVAAQLVLAQTVQNVAYALHKLGLGANTATEMGAIEALSKTLADGFDCLSGVLT